jgi:hypothetical protein
MKKSPKCFYYLEKEMQELFQLGYILLHRKKHGHELVKQFFSHLRDNWIARVRVWPPVKWSVFNKTSQNE